MSRRDEAVGWQETGAGRREAGVGRQEAAVTRPVAAASTEEGPGRPRVSVVLAVHDPGEGVRAALDHLRRTLGVTDELLVVDDGSADGTPDVVRAWLHEHPDLAARTTLLALPDNRGVAAARNHALRRATGRTVWFVDWDDRWSPRILDRLHEALTAADATVAVCGAEHVDGRGARLRRLGPRGRRRRVLEGPQIGMAVLRGRLQGYLWNKLFVREVLGDDPFPRQASQSDFSGVAEVLAAQARVVLLPDVLYAHVRRAGSLTNSRYPTPQPFGCSLRLAERLAGRLVARGEVPEREVAAALLGFRYREFHLTVANNALRLSDEDGYRRTMLDAAGAGTRWRDVAALARRSPVLAARSAVLLGTGRRYGTVYDAYARLRRGVRRGRRPQRLVDPDGQPW